MVRVSVVIPTYDRADVLPRAIDSVLSQTVEDLELLVVDDGSTDRTPSLVRSYDDPRVTYLRHEENRGGSVARNTGIEAATGDYVAFLDSDDAWRPRKLEAQLDCLESRSDEWVGAYCDAVFLPSDRFERFVVGVKRWFSARRSAPERVEGGAELVKYVLADELHTSAGSTLIVDREAVEALGGFDESFDRFQDPEFLIRVLQHGKVAHVPETLVERYESANPPADALRAADEHYLDTFAETIADIESRGYDVRRVHEFALARAYLHEGRFREGLEHLLAANGPDLGEVPVVLYSAVAGLRTRVLSSS